MITWIVLQVPLTTINSPVTDRVLNVIYRFRYGIS